MSYLTRKRRLPIVIAFGGPAGVGKTTVARMLAPSFAPGASAEWVNTDAVRKELAGVSWSVRLSAEHYTNEARDAVYSEVLTRASRALLDGRSVIVDAGFGRAKDRRLIEEFAGVRAKHFLGLMFYASLETRCVRAARRVKDPGLTSPSDADETYIRTGERFDWLEPEEQSWRTLDTEGTIDTSVGAVRGVIREFLASRSSSSSALLPSDRRPVLRTATRR